MIWTYLVEVGWTTRRPLLLNERVSWVRVSGRTAAEAGLIAAQIVGTHCTMVTSTRIVSAEL
ncbi:MAG TPA: hypothetical protein VIQ30_02325 [Pseudonocardia sp.]